MKLLYATVILGLIVYAHGESCTVNSDCVATSCTGTNSVICEHGQDGVTTDGGLCTCADTGCVYAADCHGNNAPNLNCNDDRRHCYDGQCICTRWPMGGGN